MTTQDHLFLIISDRQTGRAEVEDLGHDLGAAMEIYSTRERAAADDSNVEIVLVGSPSLNALKSTHSSYFGATDRIRGILAGAG
jgi:hypothetical protein